MGIMDKTGKLGHTSKRGGAIWLWSRRLRLRSFQLSAPPFLPLVLVGLFLLAATGLTAGRALAQIPSIPGGGAPGLGGGPDYQDITDDAVQRQDDYQVNERTPEFKFKIERDLIQLTEEMTAVAITATSMLGAFFDAKHQLQVQLLVDQFYVKARKDYQPSTPLCRFGTTRRGLISSDIRRQVNMLSLNQEALSRETGNAGRISANPSSAAVPADTARLQQARVELFTKRYCNPSHLGGTLSGGLAASDGICAALSIKNPAIYDNDINYPRMLNSRLTLDVNYANSRHTDDERDIKELMNNLFSYNLFPYTDKGDLAGSTGEELLVEMRSIMSGRSLARNSFLHIVSNRAKGTGAANGFIREVMLSMGYTTDALDNFFGTDLSYEAQMEFMTKLLYQQPNFIVSLIDTPANVKRQEASILASKIMLDRDIVEALHRRELLMSAILNEMLVDEEDYLEKNMKR